MVLPLVPLRGEGGLIQRAVNSSLRTHRELVAPTIPAHAKHKRFAADQVMAVGQRANGGEASVVLQGHQALEYGNSISPQPTADGPSPHDVVVHDLPREVVCSLKIEQDTIEWMGHG